MKLLFLLLANAGIPTNQLRFFVNLTSPTNATIGDAQGTGIIDTDLPVETLQFNVNLTSPTNATILDSLGIGLIDPALPSTLGAVMAAAILGESLTGTGDINTTATASRTSGTAPCYVHFDATNTTTSLGVNAFRDVLYLWNFGDGTSTWTYGTQASTSVNDRNLARGAVAAHVYETAGTYTAKVTPVYVDSGGTLSYGTTEELVTTVTAADTTYSGTNTICISTSGNFTGAPVGAQTFTETTVAAAYAHITADNQRILFRRGETWTANGDITLAYKGIQQDMFGASGDVPLFTVTHAAGTPSYGITGTFSTDDINYTMMNCKWDGLVQRADGVNDTKIALTIINSAYPTLIDGHVLMLNVETDLMTEAFSSSAIRYKAVVNCNFHDFTGYSGNVGIWSQLGSHFALLGSRVAGCEQIEHNVRTQGEPYSVYENNYLSQPGMLRPDHSFPKDKQIIALRGSTVSGFTTWTGVWTEFCIISDNEIDGGPLGTGLAVQVAPQSSSHDERIRDVIVERNLFTGDIANCITSEAIRCTARNNLANGSMEGLFTVQFQSLTTSPIPDDNYGLYNSLYSTTSSIESMFVIYTATGSTNMTGTTIVNNLGYAPSATQDAFSNSPAKTIAAAGPTTPVYTASNNTSNAQLTGTVPGFTIPPTATLSTWTPTSGYAVDGGTYVAVFEDFFGEARAPTYDIGGVIAS